MNLRFNNRSEPSLQLHSTSCPWDAGQHDNHITSAQPSARLNKRKRESQLLAVANRQISCFLDIREMSTRLKISKTVKTIRDQVKSWPPRPRNFKDKSRAKRKDKLFSVALGLLHSLKQAHYTKITHERKWLNKPTVLSICFPRYLNKQLRLKTYALFSDKWRETSNRRLCVCVIMRAVCRMHHIAFSW